MIFTGIFRNISGLVTFKYKSAEERQKSSSFTFKIFLFQQMATLIPKSSRQLVLVRLDNVIQRMYLKSNSCYETVQKINNCKRIFSIFFLNSFINNSSVLRTNFETSVEHCYDLRCYNTLFVLYLFYIIVWKCFLLYRSQIRQNIYFFSYYLLLIPHSHLSMLAKCSCT